MATLQSLRKRLKSVNSTKELTHAMRTVATAKYSKVSAARDAFEDFYLECESVASSIDFNDMFTPEKNDAAKNCYVLLTANKGFCGAFNAEVSRFFEAEIKNEGTLPLIISLGKKGQSFLSSRKIGFESFDLSDIPTYEEAAALKNRLLDLYLKGEVRNVYIIYQEYINMLTQTPLKRQFLPRPARKKLSEDGELVFLPDKDAIKAPLSDLLLTSEIYEILLDSAAGTQGATIVAMKSASENAEKTSEKLETIINRRRQAEVTNSVIETSSAAAAQGEW